MIKQAIVKKRLSRYLDYQSKDRVTVSQFLSELSSNLEQPVIFGGMVREFSLGNIRDFTSDIDIVCRSSSEEIYFFIKKFSPKKNKFGGFRFSVGSQLFDIWSFEDTWAFREGLVKAESYDDLLRTTFFNIDAVAFDVTEKKLISSENYLRALQNHILDVNLSENPAPAAMARRALKMALENNLAISYKLCEFILSHIQRDCDLDSNPYLEALKKFNFKSDSDIFFFYHQGSLFDDNYKNYPSCSYSEDSAEKSDMIYLGF